MALKLPKLDDREYETLLEEARKRIPIYSREWTDHNIHDPGITLLELLVWLSEMQMYHLDQITDRHYLKYLRLMGFTPGPQSCACVDLTFDLPPGFDGIIIPERTQIESTDESGEKLVFETSGKLAVSGAKIARVISDYPMGREDNTEANTNPEIYFLAFGTKAEKNSCMYIGFDRSPFISTYPALDITVTCYEDNLPPLASHGNEDAMISTSVRVVWQYCINYLMWYREDSWTDFEIEADTTMMLGRKGVVVLIKPEDWPEGPGQIFNHEESYYWIRCKVVMDGYEIPPQIDALLINTVNAIQKETFEDQKLGRTDDPANNTSTGLPNQRFSFGRSPIINALILIDDNKWDEVTDFDGSGPGDTHYIHDRDGGEILFGNGINGKIPPAGKPITSEIYCLGGGSGGNIKPDSEWKFRDEKYSGISILNKFRAAGGADSESLESALIRLKKDLKVPYRGVTLEDFNYIATHTPGLRFGRAQSIVCQEVTHSGQDFHKIEVVVVPFSPNERPEPSQGFIDTVLRHLERHRLITDRIQVKGPKYVGIGVNATVGIKPHYSEEGRQNEIQMALDNFLDPLKGGEDGKGWPFGRTVYRSEIYSLIEKVEGVECVQSLYLESTGKRMDKEGNIEIDKDALVYSTKHQITFTTYNERCRGGV